MSKVKRRLSIDIPGDPVGKERPRTTRTGHIYTPDKTRKYEALVRDHFKCKYPGWKPLTDEVEVHIAAFYRIPKHVSKFTKGEMIVNHIRPMKVPDADNIAKIITDALNGVAYHDDAQVVELSVSKMYFNDYEPGSVLVDIFYYEEVPDDEGI